VTAAIDHSGRLAFYRSTIDRWIPAKTDSILVVGGGANDEQVFRALRYQSITYTNTASASARVCLVSSALANADAESLPYADNAFDYAVVHAVLHHCASPHRALLELYRVARKAAIFFEARDSFTMRLVELIGLANPYEVSAVAANGGMAGGVRDTAVPNYVYRWTEREVEKTIASYAPFAKHSFQYAYGYGTPCESSGGRGIRRLVRQGLLAGYRTFVALVPSQRNLFACRIEKPQLPRDLQPWLIMHEEKLTFRQP